MKVRAWIEVDGGNDITAEIELPNHTSEHQIEKEVQELMFNYVSWGWDIVEGE